MDERIRMYERYCRELDPYDDAPGTFQRTAEDVATEYMRAAETDPDFEWRDIIVDGKLAGFLIICSVSHPRPVVRICEAYIRPSYRKRGLMRKAIGEILKTGVDVVMEIYKRNPAISFWQKVMNEYGYECKKETDYYLNNSLKMYFFGKGKVK